MACSLSHTIDEIKAIVEKLIDKDIVRQKAITELAVQFDNASITKDDLRKAYEKCNDIPQESCALINTFLEQESDKDYEMHIDMRLQTKQEKELQLVNNLLGEMTRYLLQKLSHAEEEMRVRLLPLDQPLNRYLLMTSKSDRRITTALEAAREEVLICIDEKQELINNYRAI
ncbi:hypothetical protein Tco_0821509 [Tanacetum coccineum]|uniref:Uncharacterized protein n=1 Tax=Tanacetum coccineum TaxID=301880 RepID=A0ABQ5ACF3_9ASTR